MYISVITQATADKKVENLKKRKKEKIQTKVNGMPQNNNHQNKLNNTYNSKIYIYAYIHIHIYCILGMIKMRMLVEKNNPPPKEKQ